MVTRMLYNTYDRKERAKRKAQIKILSDGLMVNLHRKKPTDWNHGFKYLLDVGL